MKELKVVIIGAGPAGIATAIQLKRYGIEPVIFEKGHTGGLLREANLVENYPGFPDGISGNALADRFVRHLEMNDIKLHSEEVISLNYSESTFQIQTEKRLIPSEIVVIATGTRPKIFNAEITPGAEKYIHSGISSLNSVKNNKIAVIGAGDAAFDYALSLSGKNEVVILNRGEKVRCLPLLWKRVMETDKITYKENISVKEIREEKDGLKLLCSGPAGEYYLHVQFLLVAIGREPNLDFISKNVRENIVPLQKSGALHLIGDVNNGIYRQTAISAGDGIRAGMKIYKIIRRVSGAD